MQSNNITPALPAGLPDLRVAKTVLAVKCAHGQLAYSSNQPSGPPYCLIKSPRFLAPPHLVSSSFQPFKIWPPLVLAFFPTCPVQHSRPATSAVILSSRFLTHLRSLVISTLHTTAFTLFATETHRFRGLKDRGEPNPRFSGCNTHIRASQVDAGPAGPAWFIYPLNVFISLCSRNFNICHIFIICSFPINSIFSFGFLALPILDFLLALHLHAFDTLLLRSYSVYMFTILFDLRAYTCFL